MAQPAVQESEPHADPTKLQPLARRPRNSSSGPAAPEDELLPVVIETSRGSRQKYSFDEEDRIFRPKAALPAGMAFPQNFGFVPRVLIEEALSVAKGV